MENHIVFITGGCRSGKSRFALNYGDRHFSKKIFLATSEILDEEMARRVEQHKKTRGPDWLTIEEPWQIVEKIEGYADKGEVILLDCMTLWLSNLMMRWKEDQKIMEEVNKLVRTIEQRDISFLLVSNEVGMGIVPADPLTRRFRDLAGYTNQRIAAIADKAIFMVSGIPIFLKGSE
jgi:adenosylcobinamide kinase / adenosylcobinamide-phosphate guanylyltransferase